MIFLPPMKNRAPFFFIIAFAMAWFVASPAGAALNMPFTVTMSEAVNVVTSGGTPRIAVNVGEVTRYASYTAGTGTAALTFTYTPSPGDVDLDGITLVSPLELNGGAITDLAGNAITNLTFTAPTTSGLKVDYPSLGMDFTGGAYTLNGTSYSSFSSFLTASGGSFTRGSVGTYFDSAGVLRTASSGTPRFDYDPVTHAAKGLLIEASRTNLLRNSGTPHTSSSLAGATADTATAIAPDGSTTVYATKTTTSTGQHYLSQSIAVTSGNSYVTSFYAKAGTASGVQIAWGSSGFALNHINFNLATGASTASSGVTSYGIRDVGNGWYHCWAANTATGAGPTNTFIIAFIENNYTRGRVGSYTGTETTLFLWGIQFEQGAFPTSYIPTGASAVTRAVDALSIPTGSWTDTAKGTLVASFNPIAATPAYQQLAHIAASNSLNDRLSLAYSNQHARADVGAGGVLSVNALFHSDTLATTTVHKAAMSYANRPNIASVTANGSAVTSGNGAGTGTFAAPTVAVLTLGNRENQPAVLSGTFQKFYYYPAAVTDADLQRLTQ